jgi:hypothetical protein
MVQILGAVEEDAVLAALADSGQVEAGRVVVISVEAIRERVGDRWPTKQSNVCEFAQREFTRLFDPADQLVRLNDCSYLLVQPNQLSAAAAQGRAISFLRTILQFFLGQSAPSDLFVGRVIQVRDGAVTHEDLTAEELALAERAARRAQTADAHAAKDSSSLGASRGPRNFEVLFESQPIWSCKKNAIVSYRLKPDVCESADRGFLRPVDLERASVSELVGIDLIVLDEAIRMLGDAEPNAKFGLHAPLHLSTMNSSTGRQAVFARLSAAPPGDCKRLALNFQGLDGAPRVVLDMAVATLMPFVLGVVGQAPHLEFEASAWRGARLSAISYDLATLHPSAGHNLSDALGRFAAGAEGVAGGLVIHGVSTRAEALAAWAAGFTALSGEFLGDAADKLRPMRFEPPDLYRASNVGV